MDPFVLDLISKVLLLLLGIIVSVLSFFLRGLILDSRRQSERQQQLELQLAAASKSTADTADDLRRLEDKIDIRFRESANRQDRLEERLSRIDGNVAAVLSSLQHVTDSIADQSRKLDDVGQRLSRMEGREKGSHK